MKFTYQSYIDGLKKARNYGFCISFFGEKKENELCIYLRHDVDSNLRKARDLAKTEYENDIKSTYFILLTSDFYNVFNTENAKFIKEILSYGHKIGLHFDYYKYKCEDEKVLEEKINFEKNILETFFNTKIDSFSFHRPIPQFVNKELIFENLLYTYSPKFMDDIIYISDSRMNWRNDFDTILDKAKNGGKDLQVLTHAFWYYDKEKEMKDIFYNEIYNSIENLFTAFINQITNFNEIIDEEEQRKVKSSIAHIIKK